MSHAQMYVISMVLVALAFGIFIVADGGIGTPTTYFSLVDVAPKDFEFQEPIGNVTRESLELALDLAQRDIRDIASSSLVTTFVDDVFSEAQEAYSQEDYMRTLELTQLISYIKKQNKDFTDFVILTEQKETALIEGGVDTQKGFEQIELAIAAFENERYDEAWEHIDLANLELDKAETEFSRIRSLAKLSRSFLQQYWWQILVVLFAIILITPPIAKKWHKKRLKRRLERLEFELSKMQEMIKRIQKDCFVEKKISTELYKKKAAAYQKRIAELKHTIPVLRAQIKGRKKVRQKKVKKKGILEIKE